MAVKFSWYQYATVEEMIASIEASGYTLPDPLTPQGRLVDESGEGDDLDYYYSGNVIVNYPDTGEEWEPIYSPNVYLNSARIGNSKLPSNQKADDPKAKYLNNWINKFTGEPEQ